MSKQQFPKFRRNPIFAGLPDYVKDPKNYNKIQKALLDTIACSKTHSDPSKMFDCLTCQRNTQERRALMAKMGFKNVGQYYAWKKVMHYMLNPNQIKKMPLPKYNDGEPQDTDTGIK